MQFEEFDKKVKEAAENHHPAYDEQAWAKMNKLLDKHMPEKEERRRRFAWLFFLLFLVGGTGVFYGVQYLVSTNSADPSVSSSRNRSGVPVNQTANEKNLTGGTVKERTANHTSATSNHNRISPDDTTTQEAGLNKLNDPGEKNNQEAPAGRLAASGKKELTAATGKSIFPAMKNPAGPSYNSGIAKKKKKATSVPSVVNSGSSVVDIADKQIMPDNTNHITGSQTTAPFTVVQPTIADTIAKQAIAAKSGTLQLADTGKNADPAPIAVVPVTTDKKQPPKKQSRFFLTLSAGPDFSYTANGKPGRLIPVTGIGIGYIFRERFSFRAGFYNAAKKYTASPSAYNAPASFYNYYPYLVKVDADCRVYEIPVSLGYHFGAQKNHSWFASATLSSYLMKRETYNYSFKTSAWGAVQQREWSLFNSNQHLFSVLGISGGYQRKITNRISFIAEPYLRMPVNGVGYGKVKLNSAGVLFSLAVEPAAFIPRKQKK